MTTPRPDSQPGFFSEGPCRRLLADPPYVVSESFRDVDNIARTSGTICTMVIASGDCGV